ncbi:MAG: hypothetical protein K6E12_04660 [Saccharofermentans sp.]|nr:hypothetical protein [Saccharofermentans sp.]
MDKENNEKLTDQLLRGIYRMCVNRDDCEGCPFYITKCTFEEPKPSTWFDEETIEIVSQPKEEIKSEPAAEIKSVSEPSDGFRLLSEGFKLGSEHSGGLKLESEGPKLGLGSSDGFGLLSESEEAPLGRNQEEFFFHRSDVKEESEEPEEKAEEAEEVAEKAAETVAEAPAEQPDVLDTITQQANDDDSEGTWLVSTTMGSVFTKYVFICSKCGYRKESFFSITPMTYCPECASRKNNPVSTQ